LSGIDSPTDRQIIDALQRRTAERLRGQSDEVVFAYIADAVYMERRRLQTDRDDATPDYEQRLAAAARASHQSRAAQERALLDLVAVYAAEIHNRFSEKTYSFATRVLPGALTRLLTAAQPTQLLGADFDPTSRIVVEGPVDTLKALAKTHTLVLTPTHLSNLDSPLIGYALHKVGLPPCIYGAGLNLFSNPAMSFFMSRLGAYTVDRRKQLRLYKDVLKDYSIEAIGRGAHSLFFPGGTRSRSGILETDLKKGLLGTAITAWQDGLEGKRASPEILVVPCTLSFALVLEAETLIEDALAASGKARYIITDDEFSEARTVASFARRVLNLDASTYVRFGTPLDLMGNPVDAEGHSMDPSGARIDRRAYVTDRSGTVIRDRQRDRIYTARLSRQISASYFRDNIALPTHVAGFVAWNLLSAKHPRLDVFHRVMLGREDCQLPRSEMLAGIDTVLAAIKRLQQAGRIQSALPGGAEAVLSEALSRFGGFHKIPALSASGDRIQVGPKLALYYSNRLVGYGLEKELS
jgi:glycerol-3-phosphate O-acyltransferase